MSFAGVVDRVVLGGGELNPRRPWRIWMQESEDRPFRGVVTLDPRVYLDATFGADREEADYTEGEYDPEDRTGMTWTLRVNHTNVMTEILVFV